MLCITLKSSVEALQGSTDVNFRCNCDRRAEDWLGQPLTAFSCLMASKFVSR